MHPMRESTTSGSAFHFSRASHFRTVPLVLGGTLLLGGCANLPISREPWVYAISRHAYSSEAFSGEEMCSAVVQNVNSQSATIALLCVIALPFALDTALLPITIPHDLWMTK